MPRVWTHTHGRLSIALCGTLCVHWKPIDRFYGIRRTRFGGCLLTDVGLGLLLITWYR